MTFAWYGHLKFTQHSLWIVVLVSWGIAFVEYCLAVPANRIGYKVFSPSELKIIQEIIAITVFVGFSALYFQEKITLNHVVGFIGIIAGATLIFSAPKVK
jgi:uncharacterized protein (DUF486 family)